MRWDGSSVVGWIKVLVGCKGMGKKFSWFIASRHTQVVKRKHEFVYYVYDCTYSFLFKNVTSTVIGIYKWSCESLNWGVYISEV